MINKYEGKTLNMLDYFSRKYRIRDTCTAVHIQLYSSHCTALQFTAVHIVYDTIRGKRHRHCAPSRFHKFILLSEPLLLTISTSPLAFFYTLFAFYKRERHDRGPDLGSATRCDEYALMCSIALSEFDTRALGITVGKLVASSTVSEHQITDALRGCAATQEYRVVFCSVSKHEHARIAALQYIPGTFFSEKVEYVASLNDSLISSLVHSNKTRHEVVEYGDKRACPELAKLGIEAGRLSRYHADPNIRYEQFEALYASWIQNCVDRTAADVVLVAKRDEVLAGVVTVKADTENESTRIGLFAVSEDCKKMGLGVALIAAAYQWTLDQGLRKCEMKTQAGNVFASEIFERCGGLRNSECIDFHFWLGSKRFNDVETSSDVPQNIPFFTGSEVRNLQDLFERQQIATHGKYGKLCQDRLESELGARKVLLVTSGTSALELCSLAICTQPGDEIIMPTYTFVSTATAFVNHGGVPVFVDIRRDTQNINESKIEDAITEKTKAIVVVHYAGVPCEMDTILDIARRHGLRVIEDNAHGIFSTYKGKNLGTLGDLAALSFHYTKNLSCGEGGAVVVNTPELISPCMVAWEKGTNRFDFIAGKVDKYAWVDKGSSFVMSELNAAVLAAQVCDAFVYFPPPSILLNSCSSTHLIKMHFAFTSNACLFLQLAGRVDIFAARARTWATYHESLQHLESCGKLLRPSIPLGCTHNSHIYYIRVLDGEDFKRIELKSKERKIGIFTHYVPLHESTGGKKYGKTSGSLAEAEACNTQLYRLPMWAGISADQVRAVVKLVFDSLL